MSRRDRDRERSSIFDDIKQEEEEEEEEI